MARTLPLHALPVRGPIRRVAKSDQAPATKGSAVIRVAAWEAPEVDDLPDKDALDVLARSAAAAFAIDRHDRLIYWNEGAERLLGWRGDEILGRFCYELLAGNDPFGNRYCGCHCPIMSVTNAGVGPEPFLMDVRHREARRLKVRVRAVALPEAGPRFTALVHLIDPGDDAHYEKLVKDIRATAKGEGSAPAPEPVLAVNPLTTREREIVLLLSNGFAALNIAARLNLSHATVRNHIQNILRKLEVHSQVEAISVAFRRGWI